MNIFEDKTEMTKPGREHVVTVMVPDECCDRSITLINTDVYEKSDVQHVERPRRGHGY